MLTTHTVFPAFNVHAHKNNTTVVVRATSDAYRKKKGKEKHRKKARLRGPEEKLNSAAQKKLYAFIMPPGDFKKRKTLARRRALQKGSAFKQNKRDNG